jgi:hypothetical protein
VVSIHSRIDSREQKLGTMTIFTVTTHVARVNKTIRIFLESKFLIIFGHLGLHVNVINNEGLPYFFTNAIKEQKLDFEQKFDFEQKNSILSKKLDFLAKTRFLSTRIRKIC